MRADRREAVLDFLLEAVADEGTTPFPADVLAGLRWVDFRPRRREDAIRHLSYPLAGGPGTDCQWMR